MATPTDPGDPIAASLTPDQLAALNSGQIVSLDPAPPAAPPPPAETPTEMTQDERISLMADCIYDMVNLFGPSAQNGGADAKTALQDLKTKINAVNPTKFTF